MLRLAIVFLLAANLVGAFALGEEGALRLGDRILSSVLGESEHECCCASDCACDHGAPDTQSCPTDCGAAGAAASPALHWVVPFELAEAPVPLQARALSRPAALSDFVPLPPSHVPIAA